MSSLLQRRNKKLDDLKTSISAISIVRRVEENYESPTDHQSIGYSSMKEHGQFE